MIDYGNILTCFYSNKKWSILNSFDYDSLIWDDKTKKPTKKELDLKNEESISINKKNQCKYISKNLIALCDWSVLSDVKISNKYEFENYRKTLRDYILYPVENPIFPEEPTPIWIE